MTRRFCDICDAPLTEADDKPLVRALPYIPGPKEWADGVPHPVAVGMVMITNEHNHVLTDVCNGCKLKVVTEGTPYEFDAPKIATLQPMPAADQKPPVKLFATPPPLSVILPDKPPTAQPPPQPPEVEYVPSIPPA